MRQLLPQQRGPLPQVGLNSTVYEPSSPPQNFLSQNQSQLQNPTGNNIQYANLEEKVNLLSETLSNLIKYLYGLQVELPKSLILNGLRAEFVSLNDINVPITKFELNPLLQVWACPPGTPYKIYTLIGSNGRIYLTRAIYDQTTHSL